MAVRQQAELVLASASPRRKQILEQLGLRVRVLPSGMDERELPGETPEQHVERLACGKAAVVVQQLTAAAETAWVLAADTIVVIDGRVLGKPRDDEDAVRMLLSLAGRKHRVMTGVALQHGSRDAESAVFTTEVSFRALDRAAAAAYVASGEARDAAGSYAIQGLGMGLVTEIHGSYTNVVGLPAGETLELLLRAGALEAWP
ncbi:MAG TPA: Maf family protein [Polyangiales bacterium]|nr:Maf family protein [Polyangiales bacterium]